jgi:hypothetical protein
VVEEKAKSTVRWRRKATDLRKREIAGLPFIRLGNPFCFGARRGPGRQKGYPNFGFDKLKY